MAPSNYQRGRAFEYRARNALTERGAAYIMRAAQSKGIADLIALWPLRRERYGEDPYRSRQPPWLVQCKYSINGGGYLAAAEAELLRDLAERVGAVPVFARPGPKNRGVEFTNLFTKEILVGN